MTFTIITPSFNQGCFIEETIQSVINQGFDNVEYLVMDGGSKDNTLEILKKYDDKIIWISEKDNGQSNAINKGLQRATGDIISFINSDDFYLPGTLNFVNDYFKSHPEVSWLSGDCLIVNENGATIQSFVSLYKRLLNIFHKRTILKLTNFINQPSTFWKREVFEKIGLFDETLNYTMDYDYWLRIIQFFPIYIVNKNLSAFRIHGLSKGGNQYKKQFNEELKVLKRYNKNPIIHFLHYIHNKLIIIVYKIIK